MSAADDIKWLADRASMLDVQRGIPTGGLYRGIAHNAWVNGRADLHAAIDRLQSERDELLEALRACRDYLDAIPESAAGGDDDAVRLTRNATAAIKRAEGA